MYILSRSLLNNNMLTLLGIFLENMKKEMRKYLTLSLREIDHAIYIKYIIIMIDSLFMFSVLYTI